MKKFNKRFILISLLVLLSLTMSACSIIISNKSDNKSDIKTTISNKGFKDLTVSADLADISVKYGNKYKVEYSGPKKLKPTVSRSNGALSIKQSAAGVHYINSNPRILITLPKFFLNNLKLSTDDGDITITDIATNHPISITTNDGDIDIDNLKAPKGTINTDDGDIDITRMISKSGLTLNTDDGDITVRKSNFTGYDLNTDDGDIKVKGSHTTDFFIQNKNSQNILKATTQDGDIKIK